MPHMPYKTKMDVYRPRHNVVLSHVFAHCSNCPLKSPFRFGFYRFFPPRPRCFVVLWRTYGDRCVRCFFSAFVCVSRDVVTCKFHLVIFRTWIQNLEKSFIFFQIIEANNRFICCLPRAVPHRSHPKKRMVPLAGVARFSQYRDRSRLKIQNQIFSTDTPPRCSQNPSFWRLFSSRYMLN